MELKMFISIIHGVIGLGAKSLHDFTMELFDNSTYEYLGLTHDMVRGWFRTNRNTHTYRKLINAETFSSIKFSTWLKGSTMGSWRKLQVAFFENQKDYNETLIDYDTDNHDIFIESLENQFKSILSIPIIIAKGEDNNYTKHLYSLIADLKTLDEKDLLHIAGIVKTIIHKNVK